ncbi:hypothetical protein LWI28_003852 [Acer negundo]|uniref:S-protein homolog n=1 Tax=Acer negundo TaxID=4023 RepID=A0AAD5ISP5_ACENE|nr:hypothetical protein LWI28_003852 [Acer negundo]
MHSINIKFMVVLNLCVSFQRPCLGEPVNSFPQRMFNLLFPMVTVELRNNASHHVHVKCGVEKFKEEMMLLNAGDAISWEFREILFPLKWCYVHIDNDNQGVFWASHVRLQCTHCYWSIKDDGVYFYRQNLNKWINQRLFLDSIQNMDVE